MYSALRFVAPRHRPAPIFPNLNRGCTADSQLTHNPGRAKDCEERRSASHTPKHLRRPANQGIDFYQTKLLVQFDTLALARAAEIATTPNSRTQPESIALSGSTFAGGSIHPAVAPQLFRKRPPAGPVKTGALNLTPCASRCFAARTSREREDQSIEQSNVTNQSQPT